MNIALIEIYLMKGMLTCWTFISSTQCDIWINNATTFISMLHFIAVDVKGSANLKLINFKSCCI